MRRLGGLVAVALAVAVVIVACGGKLSSEPCASCPPDVFAADVFSTDAAAPDRRPPLLDAPKPPPICPMPADVSGFSPPPYVPPHAPMNACSIPQIQGLFDACYSFNASSQKCAAYHAANMACAACVESMRSDPQWGAVVIGNGFVMLDIPGCVHIAGDMPCAKAIEAADACVWAACDLACPVMDTQSLMDWMKCSQAARATGCKKYADAQYASCSMSSAFKACTTFTGFQDGFVAYAVLFCTGDG